MGRPRILLVEDPSVPPGEIHVGGAAVLRNPSDDELGFACTSRLIRVNPIEVTGIESRLRASKPDAHIRRRQPMEV